jgi:Fe2+ or Zn2+ uptake regulation protein
VTLDALVNEVTSLLHDRGDRMTTSRRAVLEALHGRADHLPAEEVLAVASARHPKVHRTTVYRALEMLTGLGVVQHVHLGHGATAYHLATTEGHLHAQCRVCGDVIDLPRSVLDDAGRAIEQATGFRLDPDHMALSGTCSRCASGRGRGHGTADGALD